MSTRPAHRGPQDLTELTSRQRQAIQYGLKNGPSPHLRPLLVLAGAGTGKTSTLAARVAHMIVLGMDPARILLLTFSRRAAEEMTDRVAEITQTALGRGPVDRPWSGTFHAVAAKLVREYARDLALRPSFTILDRSDAADLMNLFRHELRYAALESPFPSKDTCLRIYSFATNSEMPLRVVLSRHFKPHRQWRRELRKLFRCYDNEKRRHNVVDYDDLLLYWAKLLRNARIGSEIRSRFDHVFVDEYQDTNALQADILFLLRPKGRGLTVVGDDAQAIYSFRAATIQNILEFPGKCRPRAKVITLEENFRSTKAILKAANRVIGLAKERYNKNLFSKRRSNHKPALTTVQNEKEQARYVAQQIIDSRESGFPFRQQAVLFRASNHSAELELELARRKIPFVKRGGPRFLEAAHIKDVVCVIRWCENPRDRVAGLRALRLVPGIGDKIASKVLAKVKGRRQITGALARHNISTSEWRGFVQLVRRMVGGKAGWPNEIRCVREWLKPLLHDKYEQGCECRLSDIIQLEQIAAGYSTRREFLVDLALDPPEGRGTSSSNGAQEHDYVVLSTIHSAKGKEWEIVRILNVTDGCIPSGQAKDIEEERRLLHVAMTRAKSELDLVVPDQVFRRPLGRSHRHGSGAVTCFIPDSTRSAFQYRTFVDGGNPKAW
jgi:ATP-dependent DNA helicase UvrD/PcrA